VHTMPSRLHDATWRATAGDGSVMTRPFEAISDWSKACGAGTDSLRNYARGIVAYFIPAPRMFCRSSRVAKVGEATIPRGWQ
jgi:hypothetical protein